MELPGGEDWLFQPVSRGWIKAESLMDGSVDLAFIALLNDAIAVQDENEFRVREATKAK